MDIQMTEAARGLGETYACKCGCPVQWRMGASGRRYLASMSAAYDNGARYFRGPHDRAACERLTASMVAHDAWEATRAELASALTAELDALDAGTGTRARVIQARDALAALDNQQGRAA